jgi:RNA polymerase sigma-B factor
VPTILGELRRYFRDSTWIVRPPRDLLELSLCVERVREPLGAKLGCDPTTAELAERLGRPPERIVEALRAGQSRWTRPLTSVALEDSSQSASVERAEARATLDGLLETLEPQAREVMRLRFDDDLAQAQIAARTGHSQMDVSRIIRSSLAKLSLHAAA